MLNYLSNDQKLNDSNTHSKDDLGFGRWGDEEHEKFIHGKFYLLIFYQYFYSFLHSRPRQ